MATRIDFTQKKFRPNQTQQIGEDDDAPTPIWAIKRHLRSILQRDRPDLTPSEIERRLDRQMRRGLRPSR